MAHYPIIMASCHHSPITESLAGADTRLSWRLTLLEVTPHCQSPSSSSGSASITRRLQSPVTCITPWSALIGQIRQWSVMIGHLTVLRHHIFATEQPHWLHVLLPPDNNTRVIMVITTCGHLTCTDWSAPCSG